MLLILIGYRATGKTTLARLLGGRLDCEWIDADVEIERRAGKSIARIFAEDGEPAFRDLEAEVIAELCRRQRGTLGRRQNFVLAAGGGAPLRQQSRQAMRHNGKVVWLVARPETIRARMSADATTPGRRPNLTGHDPLEEIIHLLEQREPIYRESAHLVVDTEGKTPERLVDEILKGVEIEPDPGASA